jgi:hypothetical protein
VREERRGSGDKGYLRGRKIFSGTVAFCFITLFCRMMLITVGNGYFTQSKLSHSATFITCSQHHKRILSWLLQLMFGSNTSLSKYIYLCGASSATVFQQRIISLRGASFKMKQIFA